MKVRINVTQDDIDTGKPLKADDCAVQRGIRRMCPEIAVVFVGRRDVTFHKSYETIGVSRKLPPEATELIRMLDSKKGVPQPIEFDLDIPEFDDA